MKFKLICLSFFCAVISHAQNVSHIAFGSCSNQDEPLTILDTIVKHEPDLFIFLGDNIYADTRSMDTLRAKYTRLASKRGFHKLIGNTELIATWDDHDYGENDAGKNFPMKTESKNMFLNFFNEPDTSIRRKREGIYTSYYKKHEGKVLQIIVLDCRTFRDDLKKARWPHRKKKGFNYKLRYQPNKKKQATILGAAQWAWLEAELKKPADLRLVCSSTQFIAEFNGYETWANFPKEQTRMFELIKKTRANGIIFISGDRHYAEICKHSIEGAYPISEITSSGLSSRREAPLPNKKRIADPVMENNFGMLNIDWRTRPISINFEIWDSNNVGRVRYIISADEIKFKD